VPFNFKPLWITCTLFMVYSKEKLKNNGDKTPPSFKPFLIGTTSDKYLPTRTMLRFHSDTFLLAHKCCLEISVCGPTFFEAMDVEGSARRLMK
jgi:hypothetical protein